MKALNYKIYIILTHIMLIGSFITPAQSIDSLRIKDSRYDTSYPGNYSRSFKANFKRSDVIGLDNVENYTTVIGLRGWVSDNSGGKAYELAFASGKIFIRSGYTAGWGNWERVLTDNIIKETGNGNVGIGTSTPQSKLAVNGTITATKVKVIQTGWPDYVLDSTYNLPRLSSIETYIKENHHLPNIISAAEINENGLDLGEIQRKQMQKIEELTLYLIRQNKIIEKQAKQLNALSKQITQLKKIVANSDH